MRSRTPNSPPRTVNTLYERRDACSNASTTLAAAAPSACGPGGQSRATRASMLRSCTWETTRSSAYPPIDASLHGTTNPSTRSARSGRDAGGVPRTASETSFTEQRASMATMAATAEANASVAAPISRRAGTRASRDEASIKSACVAPAKMIGASGNNPATRLISASPSSPCHSGDPAANRSASTHAAHPTARDSSSVACSRA